MDIVVRPVAAADRDAWFGLWQGYLAFYGVELADSVSRHSWDRLLDEHEPLFGLVAETKESGPRIVGLVNCVLHANTWSDRPVCYLEDLFVDPAHRKAGAGRALIEEVVAMAREKDWRRVYWMTKRDNAVARGLYDKVATATDWVRYDAQMQA